MELKDISTEKLIEELENREKVRVYDLDNDGYQLSIRKKFAMPIRTSKVKKIILFDN